MIDIADFAVGLSRRLGRQRPGVRAAAAPDVRTVASLWPVAVITAFNFPAAVWAWNAMIAAVCGDTVVWKPSPKALTAIAVQRIADEVASRHEAAGGAWIHAAASDENWPVEHRSADPRSRCPVPYRLIRRSGAPSHRSLPPASVAACSSVRATMR